MPKKVGWGIKGALRNDVEKKSKLVGKWQSQEVSIGCRLGLVAFAGFVFTCLISAASSVGSTVVGSLLHVVIIHAQSFVNLRTEGRFVIDPAKIKLADSQISRSSIILTILKVRSCPSPGASP